MPGIKHLIQCFCKLKILEKTNFNHKFPVYSKIDESSGKIIKKNVKCNNCEAYHEVYEIGKSNIIPGKEQKVFKTFFNISRKTNSHICRIIALSYFPPFISCRT